MKFFVIALLFYCSTGIAKISSESYVIVSGNGNVIAQKNADTIRPIASITKLITVQNSLMLDGAELIKISKDDTILGRMKSSPLIVNREYSRLALSKLALVSSDNVAAIALGRTNILRAVPSAMQIVEASGLNPANTSSANTLANFARSLYDTDLALMSVQKTATIGLEIRRSTNPLLASFGWHFYLSKTGFINESGGCLVVILEVRGEPMTFVILGSSDTHRRWLDLFELRKSIDNSNFAKPTWAVTPSARHVSRHRKHR